MTKKTKKSASDSFVSGYMDATLNPELLIDFFEKSARGKSYGMPELLTIFSAGHKRKRELEASLASLVAGGKLVRLKGPAYTLPQGLKNVRGHIKIQRQGMGFVRPEAGGEEIYIHPSQINGAWDGDLVLAGILPGQSGKSREGRVLEVLERRVRELLVELLPQSVKEEDVVKRLARPLDTRMAGYLLIDLEGLEKRPRQGDMVLAEPLSKTYSDGIIRAKATSSFGAGESLPMFERLVKAEHNIATEFPAPALREAARLPSDPNPVEELVDALADEPDAPARRDMRHIDFVTIDGSDARDFDDAVYVERDAKGYTLWVAIADVANYVAPGSVIDREAMKRGNSCYFPASVEPMLPQELSNGLCSLRPGMPRLAVVAEIAMNGGGVPQKSTFYRALVQSHARLTYDGAQEILDDPSSGSALAPMLREAQKLSEALLKRREERGTLNFDLPEARAEVDAKGKITALVLRERLFTHRLIEEFMIAANEAVAVHLAGYAEQGLSFLYRTHPAPDADKLADLAKVLAQAGLDLSLPERPEAGDLQQLLEAVKGTAREFVINRLVLRSLMQAVYSPVPEGHFGLASSAYAHFTSPIRRYADLTVHRALLHTLGYAGKVPSHGTLAQIADGLNDCEREAVAAEREIFRTCAALYLRDYLGEEFEAAVSGVSAFGLFVELSKPPCEGFVRLESLPDDYYQLDPERHVLLGQRSGARFTLGQPMQLRLVKADPLRQEITFELVNAGKNLKVNDGGKRSSPKPGSAGTSGPPRGNKKRQSLPKGSVRRRTQ